MAKPPLIVLAGPTASGKTGLSIKLAHELHGEIIAMDSMQVYRGMDIGTAKPTLAEREGIAHHMLDVADPRDAFSVADYVEQAKVCIDNIHQRGKLPILAGGTGLYLKALTTAMTLGETQGDGAIRSGLMALAEQENGKAILHGMLKEADPVTAGRLHPNDVRRVVRALEVMKLTGKPISAQQPGLQAECPFSLCILGLNWDQGALYRRIEKRVDNMMVAGLLGEVEGLLTSGVSPASQSMQGLGYKELVPVLTQGRPLSEAVEAIKLGTRHYAKRQMTWFRRTEDIRWLDGQQSGLAEQALGHIRAFLDQGQ